LIYALKKVLLDFRYYKKMFNKFIFFLKKLTFLNFLSKKIKKKIYFLFLWIFSAPERIFFH